MGTEETGLPKLAAPARRALHGAGYTHLEDLTKVTESEGHCCIWPEGAVGG